ncbi:hypothetical protein ACOSQ2_008213 [Xanthoceras sorbifolium]
MALSIACGESSSSLQFIIFRLVNQALDSIKLNVAQLFFNSRSLSDDDMLPCTLKNIMENVADGYRTKTRDLFCSNKEDYDDKGDPQAVFNVLDAMLKENLDRLKTMRENISLANIGVKGCSLETDYREHVAMIRDLSLGGKLGAALCLRRKLIWKGIVPDILTHNYLINGLCKTGDMEKADWLIGEMSETGPSPNCATYNAFIKGYCNVNDVC